MERENASINPPTTAFGEFPVLLAAHACWVAARGEKILPTRSEYFDNLLNFPEVIPVLATLELDLNAPFTYKFVGSEIVQRQAHEITGESAQTRYDQRAWELIQRWLISGRDQPTMVYSESKTLLNRKGSGRSMALSAVLSDDEGTPSVVAVVTIRDKNLMQEPSGSRFKSGSGGIEFVPLDIGFGSPDLPVAIP